jgi:hypothetical protein
MVERGFVHVGVPLEVQNPHLQKQLRYITTLSRSSKSQLARDLTRQAEAEHECAVETLDNVVRVGEMRVVRTLVEEFPQYGKLLK